MLQHWLIFALFLLSSCDKQGGAAKHERERKVLVSMATEVAQDMVSMGFPLDLNRVTIEVQDAQEMAQRFNAISDESARGVNTITPFAPKVGLITLDDSADEASQNARLAFYDPNTKTIVFTKGASATLSKGYLAHELAHVYQDQKWGFETMWQPYQEKPSRELFNITQFMIEGYAELVRQTYEQREADSSREVSALSLVLGKFAEAECIECFAVKSMVNLPYSLGLRFLVHQFRIGGWPLVESFLSDMPTSTEQIIHPKKLKRDEPRSISLPTFHDAALSTKLASQGSLGEAFLLSKLLSMSMPIKEAFECASGFEGDIAQLYQTAAGDEALVWRIAFDRTLDAQQLEESLSALDKPLSIMRTGPVVDFLMSDNAQLTSKLRVFLSKHPFRIEPDPEDEQTTLEQEIVMKNERGLLKNPYYD